MKKEISTVIQEMTIRDYSPKTIKIYVTGLNKYFYYKKENVQQLDVKNIKQFLLYYSSKGSSAETRNLYLNAIKFYYYNIVKIKNKIEITPAKRNKSLPVVLNRKEILILINVIKNPKHRLLLSTAYGAGLRVSEVVNIKVQDVDLDNLTLHIKNAKGKKDRISIMPEIIKDDLRKIVDLNDKDAYIFASERGGRLTTRTVQMVFSIAMEKSDITKDATFHSLRHSFATHLLENGVNIRYVQELLGHQNIRTTQRYTQVTNPKLKKIKSPL